MTAGTLHHLELWVEDLDVAVQEWGWLLGQLGWTADRRWAYGRSWRLGDAYVVVEAGTARVAGPHERLRAGLNHVAFHAGARGAVDAIVVAAPEHGWTLMFPDRHPHAGGDDHYAAYLENGAGFEVELVAEDRRPGGGTRTS